MRYLYLLILLVLSLQKIGVAQDSLQGDLDLKYVIETTLKSNPNIKIQEQVVESSRGSLLTNIGSFDPTLALDLEFTTAFGPEFDGTNIINPVTRTTIYTAELTKLLNWGGNLTLELEMERELDSNNFRYASNTATVLLELEIPLLQGLGTNATEGAELAARYTLAAERKNYIYTLSQQVQTVVLAYWTYVAAADNYRIQIETLDEAEKYYQDNKLLAENDNIPGSNLVSLLATISQNKIDLATAEQNLYSARQSLGIAMGVNFEEIDRLSMPGTHFPKYEDLPDSSLVMSLQPARLTSIALDKRYDYQSSLDKVTSSNYLLKQAENGTLTELDLTLSSGYSGFIGGNKVSALFSPFYKNVDGLNFGITLAYTIPFRNNTAKGNLITASATYMQNRITSAETERQIRSSVAVSLREFQTAYLNFLQGKLTVEYYKRALKDEKEKVKLGTSGVINVDYLERSLLTAKLSHVKIRQAYANALLNLKFATGTLLDSRGNVNFIDISNIMNLK